jgi:hypothetical protein
MRFAVLTLAAFALASCAGTPTNDKVAAAVESAGACKALPEGVTCDCVVSTAQSLVPSMKIERSKDETGSRLGRGTVGQSDPRVPLAIEAATQSCAAGKAVG